MCTRIRLVILAVLAASLGQADPHGSLTWSKLPKDPVSGLGMLLAWSARVSHLEEARSKAEETRGLGRILGRLKSRATESLASSRGHLMGDDPAGVRAWFARLHWVLVASVATSQLVTFGGGVSRLVARDPATPTEVRPARKLARPTERVAAGQRAQCDGIRLGEVLLDASGAPVFATLSARGQAYQFPRRIGDRLGGSWTLSKLSVGKAPDEPNHLEARVELKSPDQSCVLATQRVRSGHYSAAL